MTTNAFSHEIEDKIIKLMEPYGPLVESVVSSVGEGTVDPNIPSAFGQKDTPNKARFTINFQEFQFRTVFLLLKLWMRFEKV